MPLNPNTELESLTTLLALFHHRNKNQHRLAKWYKHLTIFLRQTKKLHSSVTGYHSALELSSKSKYTVEAREKLVERIEFCRKWVIERCYLAFSNVVADNQYAASGLFLLGVLARLGSVLKVLEEELDLKVDVQEIDPPEIERAEVSLKGMGDDFGEVIDRATVEALGEGAIHRNSDPEEDTSMLRRTGEKNLKRGLDLDEVQKEKEADTSTPSKKPKKKRKKGDVFDDLFSGLI